MITENLSAFLTDFGIELEFLRESVESSSSSSSSSSSASSSSSSSSDASVLTATFIWDAPPSEISVYDRAFFDEKFYKASMRAENVTLLGVEADVSGLELNDYTIRNSVRWYAIGRIPDGTGMMTVVLSQSRLTKDG